jgi:putative transport protein
LQFGDTVLAVGEAHAIQKVAAELGDSPKQLNHPQMIPILVGIVLGVIVGSCPIFFPGLPAPVRFGLAGGPLIVAIILSRLGRVGPLVWYMPISANFMMREIGIVLFLACVGLRAGGQFVNTLVQGDGFRWMLLGACITLIPLLVVALIARIFMKLNYASLCGVLAGSMTDPPALAFAGQVTGSEAPYVSYATVYPLTMLLRVIGAQALILVLMRLSG